MARQFGNNSDEAAKVKQLLDEERAEEEAKMKKIRLGVGIGLGVLFLGLNIANIVHINSTIRDTEQIRTDITIAKQAYDVKLAEINSASENSAKQEIEVDPVVNNAKEVCTKIRDVQNNLTRVTQTEKASDLGITAEHQSLLLDMQSFNLGKLGDGTWSEYGVWYFTSDYDFEGTSLDVTWICYDDANDSAHRRPLCYATGTYDANTEAINTFELHYTDWYRVDGESYGDTTSYSTDPVVPDQAGQSGPPDTPSYEINQSEDDMTNTTTDDSTTTTATESGVTVDNEVDVTE